MIILFREIIRMKRSRAALATLGLGVLLAACTSSSDGGSNSAGPVIMNPSMPTAVLGETYAVQLDAVGGTTPYQFSVASGSLPAGLTLSGTSISGTPSTTGSSTFFLRVTDSSSPEGSSEREFTISVTEVTGVTILTTALPIGIEGQPYTAEVTAAGGTPPYTYRIAAGTLPTGISFDSQTGRFSGTAAQPGSSLLTFEAADTNAETTQTQMTMTITSASAGGIGLVATPSRTRGVAPLAVFFDASQTTSVSYPKSFHHLHYAWDFSDPGSRRPQATGPVAAHVFESPGTYTVNLTVSGSGWRDCGRLHRDHGGRSGCDLRWEQHAVLLQRW